MSEYALQVNGIGKQYRIGSKRAKYGTLRDAIADTVKTPFRRARSLLRGQAYGAAGLEEEIWALKDITFDVRHGDVVGIIGRNGAGKSTLLKVLSRITDPTEGYADVYGRVGALLEVGTGFHEELTGRENIYLNAAILGMSRYEIDLKFDEMVHFAEVEKFIDTPVKHYSSGMKLRLGFAVAAHLEPEILIVDEVLAVGDASFQKKSLGKMNEVAKQGRTVLFVSHNMAAIASLCTRGIMLEQGQIRATGDIRDVVDEYLKVNEGVRSITDRKTSSEAYFESVTMTGPNSIDAGEHIGFEVVVHSNAPNPIRASINWHIIDELGYPVGLGHTYVQFGEGLEFQPGKNNIMLDIGPLMLAQGEYTISLELDMTYTKRLDLLEDVLNFTVRSCTLESKNQSIKSAWRKGSVVFPFDIQMLPEVVNLSG